MHSYSFRQLMDQNLLSNDLELPYIVTSGIVNDILPDVDNRFVFNNVRGTPSTAMYIGPAPDAPPLSVEELDDQVQLNLYPNPVANYLTADVELEEPTTRLEYQLTDLNDRLILKAYKENITTDQSIFNMTSLSAGQYILTIRTDKGIKSQHFSVNH